MASRGHTMSFSESAQQSLVLGQLSVLSNYHHGSYQTHRRHNIEDPRRHQQTQPHRRESHDLQGKLEKGQVSECQYIAGNVGRMLLVLAMFGVEGVMSIETIYMLLILQYLGCPVYLMSMGGVITGLVSLVLIPVIGQCSNSGQNLWKRKLYALCFGLFLFLVGTLLVTATGIMRTINPRDDINILPTTDNFTGTYSNSTELYANSTEPVVTPDESNIPVAAIIGIVAFALCDTAYDASAPIVRSFALATLHPHEHSAALATSTIIQAFGGSVFCVIGLFDIPHVMETYFGFRDGMTGLILLVYSLLILAVIISFVTTIFSGYILAGKSGRRNPDTNTYASLDKSKRVSTKYMSKPYGEYRYSRLDDVGSPSCQAYAEVSGSQSVLVKSGDATIDNSHEAPGLDKDSVATLQGGNLSTSCKNSFDANRDTQMSFQSKMSDSFTDSRISVGKKEGKIKTSPKSYTRDIKSGKFPSGVEDKVTNTMNYGANTTEKQALTPQRISSRSSIYGSNITSGDITSKKTQIARNQKKDCDTDNNVTNLNQENRVSQMEETTQRKEHFLCNKQLIIMTASCFFAHSSFIAISVYSANALTIGIYQGDPQALPGTTGRDQYELGIRASAFGSLVVFVSSFLGSLCNGKIIQMVGAKPYFIGTCGILTASLAALIYFQTEFVYFITMTIYGGFRGCQLTVPFVLVSKIMTSENDAPENSKDLGRAISLLGLTMPVSYLILSSILGPLIDATGDVWMPILYSIATTIVAGTTMMLLYCVN